MNERAWILKVMLTEFLGLDYTVENSDSESMRIEAQGRTLEMPDAFFIQAEHAWLKEGSLPGQPLKVWDMSDSGLDINCVDPMIPVIFGDGSVDLARDRARLGLDIFGSAFFMLSRYEEAVKTERDRFGRFPAEASLVCQEGFLDRPIVNEYLEILWSVMKHLWPDVVCVQRRPQTRVSCDVDVPYAPGTKSVLKLLRQMGGDIVRRKDPMQAVRSIRNYVRAKKGDYTLDPFLNALDRMMDVNEAAGNRMAFYMIADHSDADRDGCYSIHEPVIRALIRRIAGRGHEIGLHASFHTDQDSIQFCKEADILRTVLKEEGVEQETLGARQHFLRWQTPITARSAEQAGMAYDATLGFADHAGFRCGVCYEYPFYDVVDRREMVLRERPLIVMDQSVFAYMKCSFGQDGRAVFERLKKRCRQFNGDFTVLWHNYQFLDKRAMKLYREVIQ